MRKRGIKKYLRKLRLKNKSKVSYIGKVRKTSGRGKILAKKGIPRKRLVPLPRLIKKVDSIFSLWIRKRDGEKCVLCGSRVRVQNGHLIRRGKRSVRFDDVNCHAQCSSCNYKHNFEPEHYTNWFIREYGSAMYEDLVDRSRQTKKWTRDELENLIKKYENVHNLS